LRDEEADLQVTWAALSGRFSDLDADVTQSLRASDQTVAPDGEGALGLRVRELPLLSLADEGEVEELITQRVLGEGGMGKVELAIQRCLRREVAIKSTRGDVDGPNAQALLQEALVTGLLEHPNVVPVHQLGRSSDDFPLLVMKRVEGVSWEELILDPGHPTWSTLGSDRLREHIAILISVCNAVEFAHSRGIVHRDIKPANVMVGAFGEVYLLDWGLAMRLEPPLDSTAVVGTPCQMAPEMLDGAAHVSERTDVYLLGACLHTALTGRRRHTGSSLQNVIYAACQSLPVTYPGQVPRELAELCNQATHVDPANRPPSAAAFRQALERYLEHRSSIELAAEAASALATLRGLLEAEESDRERVAGLFAECRFGFGQALRAWPENPAALDGLQDCLTLVIERELRQRNIGLAEALLDDLPRPAPELGARVAALRDEVRARESRLAELEHQGDWREGAGARVAVFLVFVVACVGLWMWGNDGHVRYEGTLSPRELATNMGVAYLALLGTVYAVRRQLLASQVNRQLVGGALMTGGVIFLHRLANCIPVPPTAALISGEILLCALGSSLGGLLLARWLWLQVPVWVVGAFAARLLPGYAGLCFLTAGLIALGLGLGALYRERAKADRAGATQT
jgi:eukaryotic-like serine/threonine-protein kinase